jgi:hypothetical protein
MKSFSSFCLFFIIVLITLTNIEANSPFLQHGRGHYPKNTITHHDTPQTTTTTQSTHKHHSLNAPPQPHVWQSVTSKNGTWYAKLSPIYESMTFVSNDTNYLINAFYLTPSAPMTFGLVITEEDDFDMLFILTLVQTDLGVTMESRRVCSFMISAYGPANPQITPVSYNGGAQCTYEIAEVVGFYVQ